MKKLLLIGIFWAATAGLASATSVTCGVLMTPNTTGSTGESCTINADPGFFISSLTLTATDDYTGLQSGSPTVSYQADLTQSTTVFTGATFCNVTSGGSGSIPCAVTILPANTVTGLDLASYTIQLTDAGNTVTGGVITGASIVLNTNFGETLSPVSPTPEPNTLSLMGIGLLGLGFVARKRISQASTWS
jgi:hypothetical protein